MRITDTAGTQRRTFHLVLSTCVERAYPGDPLSVEREACEVAPFDDRDAAEARLLAELDANLSDGAVLALRRSFVLEVAVPTGMLGGGGCPRRWAADRWTELLRRVGASPGAWWRATRAGRLSPLLLGELASAIEALGHAMGATSDSAGGVPALALSTAGAARRAAAEGAISAALEIEIIDVAKAIGAAAWAGEDVSHLAAALEALMPEAPPPSAPDGVAGFGGLLGAVPPPDGGWGAMATHDVDPAGP